MISMKIVDKVKKCCVCGNGVCMLLKEMIKNDNMLLFLKIEIYEK